MGAGTVETSSRQFDQPDLDDDAPRAKGGIMIARRQHASNPSAAGDAAAVERRPARAGCALPAPREGNVD